jgi:hypothetical protein
MVRLASAPVKGRLREIDMTGRDRGDEVDEGPPAEPSTLPPGSASVAFAIDPRRDLSFPDETGRRRLEAGFFRGARSESDPSGHGAR